MLKSIFPLFILLGQGWDNLINWLILACNPEKGSLKHNIHLPSSVLSD